jgi:hypothetical protein
MTAKFQRRGSCIVGALLPVSRPPSPGSFTAHPGFKTVCLALPREHCWAASASRITVLGEVRVVSAY